MEALLSAAARALAAGDALLALKHVALRDDPPGLALRGIAMAQLGELVRARDLLRRAAQSFGPRHTLARARCIVAESEVALALRDFSAAPRTLAAAAAHPASVMDMSFADQALSVEYLVKNRATLEKKVYPVPEDIDKRVAKLKLESMGVKIDRLTPEQEEYLASWSEGT